MRILKFGGSSLAKPDRVERVCGIVRRSRDEGPIAVVVSAFGGVTDSLIAAAHAAARRDGTSGSRIDGLEKRHQVAAESLASEVELEELLERITTVFRHVRELVHGASILRETSDRTLDAVASVGETLSAAIVAAALRRRGVEAEDCDARRLIVTEPRVDGARVKEVETRERIRRHFAEPGRLQVVTGFIASTEDEETTTLGRGGSDYTASILGSALRAEAVELWTDVDGVLSADPSIVQDAVPNERLSYDELMELAHFGAKVVHPPSVHPARRESIPLWIKNTFRPDWAGTFVTDVPTASASPVRGVASIGRVTLLRLEGDGMIGVSGIAMRLFGALAREGVSVIMISQASSEHSICFVVSPTDAEVAARSIAEEFAVERRAGLIDDLVIEERQSVVAAIGAGMRERCGVAARLFGVLGRHGINVRAIAQGSSELNISLVVDADDEVKAVNAIHDAFFVPGWSRVEIALAGIGGVGGALLEQFAERAAALERERGLRLHLVAVADSRGAVLNPAGIDPASAVQRLRSTEDREALDTMIEYLECDRGSARVLVDCTASETVPAKYGPALRSGAAVVTANKLPFAGPLDEWHALRDAGPGRLYHETTVGAALPVIRTLQELIATGDRVRRIEGVLSGTLGFLLDQVTAGRAFSEALRIAHERGYTEPDPREDLGGRDVARKLLTLARLLGRELSPEDVDVMPLLPDESWGALLLDEFWARVPEADETMVRLRDSAAAAGKRLVYLAQLGEGEARVGLEMVDRERACARVRGSDNLVAFTTDRYHETPLVVQGPGAGPGLTASGVFADLLRAIDEAEGGGA